MLSQLPCADPEKRIRRYLSYVPTVAALVLSMLGAACDGPSPPPQPDDRSQPADVITWLRSFDLEEREEVINVQPNVFLDSRGGFLVADASEAQLRRYAPEGQLYWHAGRKGAGPGEFTAPTAVVRLRSGEVLAADRAGRLTVFDSTANVVIRTHETRIGHLEDMAVVDDSLVLIAGILGGKAEGSRLYIWNVASNTLAASFFAPFRRARNRTAATVAGWSRFSIRGDTVAAIFATSDTLYLFTVWGRPLGKVEIPFRGFRYGERDLPKSRTDPRARAQWLSSFDFVADVHWLPDGSVLVPYQSVKPEGALERAWHLLRMTPAGERIFDVRNVPRLLEVNSADGSLYFVHPAADAPNRWSHARLQ